MLPTALGQYPDDIAAALVQTPVEPDEGAKLSGRVAGLFPQLGYGPRHVGAPLCSVDEGARQPCLGPVDVVDGGLGHPGPAATDRTLVPAHPLSRNRARAAAAMSSRVRWAC